MEYLLFKKFKINKILYFICFTFLLTFVMEALLRGNISDAWSFICNHLNRFIFNYSIVLLTLSPSFLFKKRPFYICLISIIWLILSIANNILLNLRGTPLTGGDLNMIKSGLSIINQYISTSVIICISLLSLLIIISLIVFYFKCPKSNPNYKIVLPCILIYGLLFPQIVNYVLDKGIVTTNFFDVRARYIDYGFSYSFLNSVINNGVSKPDDYSKNSMENIENKLGNTLVSTTDNSYTTPNIIFVQLESFIDPLWIETVNFNEDPIPNFRNIYNNYTSGLLTIPGLGGGTANSEFEVITGFASNLFGTGEFPFNTLLSSNTCPSIAYYLKNLNYSTHALHNNDATFYSRYKAYKNLGFDTFTPIECMLTPERTPMGWAKDSYLISEVKNLLESTPNPDLAFTVSVQGHGSYPNLPLDNPVITVSSDNEIKNLNSIKYYVNQLHEMDEFIGNLISTVNSLNEPSVIVFYGDHHPAIDVSAEDFTTNSLYTTPYAIWDNINLSKESVNLNAYELSSLIIKKLNLPKTILSSLYSSNIDEETKYKYLHLIEYDSLYGKDYLNYADSLEASSSFNYGINVPIINDVQVDNNITTITGQYFNTFSKVFVNGSAIDSTYINPNTLQFTNYKCKTNDIITVKQMAGAGKIELLSSEDFTFK